MSEQETTKDTNATPTVVASDAQAAQNAQLEALQKLVEQQKQQLDQLATIQAQQAAIPKSEAGNTVGEQGNTLQTTQGNTLGVQGNTQSSEYIKDLNQAPEFSGLSLEWGEFDPETIRNLQHSSILRLQFAQAFTFQNVQVVQEGSLVTYEEYSNKRHRAGRDSPQLISEIDSQAVSDEAFRTLVSTYHSSTILPSLASFNDNCKALTTQMDVQFQFLYSQLFQQQQLHHYRHQLLLWQLCCAQVDVQEYEDRPPGRRLTPPQQHRLQQQTFREQLVLASRGVRGFQSC